MAKSERTFGSVKQFETLMLRVWRKISEDNVAGLAAQVAFFFVLSLFPFFILLAAVVGLLPSTQLWGHLLKWATLYLPESSQTLVFNIVAGLTRGRVSFLSLGVLSAAWAASGGVYTLTSSLNTAYDVVETRKLWKRALLTIFTVFVVCLLFLGSFGLLTGGQLLATWIAAHLALGLPILAIWRIGHWLVSLALLTLGISTVYYLLPNCKLPWHWITPGTLLAVAIWVPGTLGFNFYVQHIANYNTIYGALAGFMIMMVWIYLVSLVVLAGAELNHEMIKMRAGTGAGSPDEVWKGPVEVTRADRRHDDHLSV